MKTVAVNASNKYNIIIEHSLLDKAGKLCADTIGVCKGVIITDSNVDKLYSKALEASLVSSGYEISKFVFEAGEKSKNTQTLISIVEFLAEQGLTRSDCIFALGGGVVGDIAGFAAAIYMRGIRFVQFPTTLLAAVDSSVGGKTAVDLDAGKNLVGAFHQPSLVLCDYSLFDTLSPEIFADGCAEAIKYGVINDSPLFELINDTIDENLEEIIASCVLNKARIVECDEFDTGKRQLLNLGHTVGHAIEKLSAFSISHGSAVAIGMVIVMRAAVKLGYCKEEDLRKLISLLQKTKLPIACDYTASELALAALSDKKRKGNTITLAIPYGIGDTRLVDVPITELESFIEKGLR